MSGLGQSLAGINQGRARGAAMSGLANDLGPVLQAAIRERRDLDPTQKALLQEIERQMFGGGAPTAPGAPPSPPLGPSDFAPGGIDQAPLNAPREGSVLMPIPSMEQQSAELAGQRPMMRIPEMGVNAGGGGDLPRAFASLLSGVRTRGDLARAMPLLSTLEGMIGAKDKRAFDQAMKNLVEGGKSTRAATKAAEAERQHRETITSREGEGNKGRALTQAQMDQRAFEFQQTMVSKEGGQKALADYRNALLALRRAGNERAAADQFIKLINAFANVGQTLSSTPKRAEILSQLGNEVVAEMKKRGFPMDADEGPETPGLWKRARNWIGERFGGGARTTKTTEADDAAFDALGGWDQ